MRQKILDVASECLESLPSFEEKQQQQVPQRGTDFGQSVGEEQLRERAVPLQRQ